MRTKIILAGLLAAFLSGPAFAECTSDHQSVSTPQTPVASAEKPAPVSKPAGG